MRRSWLFAVSVDYAVTQMCGVAAFEPAHELQFDVVVSGRREQPPSVAQQYGNNVQFEFVELAGCQQRLRRTRAMDQHGSISRCFPGDHCERIIGTIRREVLDHVLIMGQAHVRQVLAAYQMHYNEHRPHQSRDQLPPDAAKHPAAIHDLDTRRLLRTRILGGLINEYSYAA